MFHLNRETDADWWEVEALYDLCFAPGREALSSYRFTRWNAADCRPVTGGAGSGWYSGRRHSLLAGLCRGASCALAWAHCRPPNPAGRGAGGVFDFAKAWPWRPVLGGIGCCWWGMHPITKDLDFARSAALKCRHPPTPNAFWACPWHRGLGMGCRARSRGPRSQAQP